MVKQRYVVASIEDDGAVVVTVQGVSAKEMTGVSLYLLQTVHQKLEEGGYAEMAELIGSVIIPLRLIMDMGEEKA